MALDASLYVPDVTAAKAPAVAAEAANPANTPTSQRAGARTSGGEPSVWILVCFLVWAVVLFGGVHLDFAADVGD